MSRVGAGVASQRFRATSDDQSSISIDNPSLKAARRDGYAGRVDEDRNQREREEGAVRAWSSE